MKKKKLKWKHQSIERRWLAEYEPNRYIVIDVWGRRNFKLRVIDPGNTVIFIPFKKLSSAKKVAQLIYNG